MFKNWKVIILIPFLSWIYETSDAQQIQAVHSESYEALLTHLTEVANIAIKNPELYSDSTFIENAVRQLFDNQPISFQSLSGDTTYSSPGQWLQSLRSIGEGGYYIYLDTTGVGYDSTKKELSTRLIIGPKFGSIYKASNRRVHMRVAVNDKAEINVLSGSIRIKALYFEPLWSNIGWGECNEILKFVSSRLDLLGNLTDNSGALMKGVEIAFSDSISSGQAEGAIKEENQEHISIDLLVRYPLEKMFAGEWVRKRVYIVDFRSVLTEEEFEERTSVKKDMASTDDEDSGVIQVIIQKITKF